MSDLNTLREFVNKIDTLLVSDDIKRDRKLTCMMLRREAIRWVKYFHEIDLTRAMNTPDHFKEIMWIKYFFNISEGELNERD